MKKHLLLISSLLIGFGVSAQFTQSNAPVIGDGATLYIVDSNATAYDNITGSGATWDYSQLAGYGGETRTITILDPSTTTYSSNFPSSTEALELQGLLTNYTTNSATERVSQGFVLHTQQFGDVVAAFDTDEEKVYTYPFDVGSTVTDVFSGTYTINMGMPTSGTITGNVTASVDGKGTLKLAENDYTNVYRYKLVDTNNVQGVPLMGDITMIRVQYEYYDFATSNLPIFVHTSVNLYQAGSTTPLQAQTIVLSLEDPTNIMAVNQEDLDETVIYPNPASNNVTINLPSAVDKANVVVMDALGRKVLNTVINNGTKKLNISSLNQGVYFVKIQNGNISSTKRLVIK